MTLWQRLVGIVVCAGLAYFLYQAQQAGSGWLYDTGVYVSAIALVLIGLWFIPIAARTIGEEETLECPTCNGVGETSEGRYIIVNGREEVTYRCPQCGGDGSCSNGQAQAGMGCGCVAILIIALGIGTLANRLGFLGEAKPPGGPKPEQPGPKNPPDPKPEPEKPAIPEGTKPAPKTKPAVDPPMPRPVDPPTPAPPEKKPVVEIPPEKSRVRIWKTADGKFTVEAEFRSMTAGLIKLKRVDNGQEISVPLDKLSAEDQKWVRDFRLSR